MKKLNKWAANMAAKLAVTCNSVSSKLQENKGDFPIQVMGGLLLSVLALIIVIAAINEFFPELMSTLFGKLKTALENVFDDAVATTPTFP